MMTNFAWTPGRGAYKHYPPYVNLTGNLLTVRGTERLDDDFPMPGYTVAVELPDDQRIALAQALTDHTTKGEE